MIVKRMHLFSDSTDQERLGTVGKDEGWKDGVMCAFSPPFLTIMAVSAIVSACNLDLSGKVHCYGDDDCVGGRECLIREDDEIGTCVFPDSDNQINCTDDDACPNDQICHEDICIDTCNAIGDCDSDSLCLNVGIEKLACVPMDPCPEEGECPVEPNGAFCNQGDVAGKGEICLEGMCKDAEHCPGGSKCIVYTGFQIGLCSDGSIGSACNTTEDCLAGLTCYQLLGYCM